MLSSCKHLPHIHEMIINQIIISKFYQLSIMVSLQIIVEVILPCLNGKKLDVFHFQSIQNYNIITIYHITWT
jgi:hypothetical protein